MSEDYRPCRRPGADFGHITDPAGRGLSRRTTSFHLRRRSRWPAWARRRPVRGV